MTEGWARILVAEDSPINRELALGLLQTVGLDVDVANNGQEAVEKAKAGAYDLILMDIQMPVMDGLEATRAIRALPGFAGATPILAITAHAADQKRLACDQAGMNDILDKPVQPDELFATILKWLKGGEVKVH